MSNTAAFRLLITKLRKHFPVESPVVVRRRPSVNLQGSATFDGNKFTIVVCNALDWSGIVDTLLHEWAHVLAIEEAYRHNGTWARFHGHIYESYSNDFKG